MAPPPPEAQKAMFAMREMGFPVNLVKTVLKELLKLFNNNWTAIEGDNYQLLVESILTKQHENEAAGDQFGTVCNEPEPESEPQRKRLRKLGDRSDSLVMASSGDTSYQRQIAKENVRQTSPQPSGSCERDEPDTPLYRRQTRASTRAIQSSPHQDVAGSASHMAYQRGKRSADEMTMKQPKTEAGSEVLPSNRTASAPLIIKEEPNLDEVPLAMIHPTENEGHQSQIAHDNSPSGHISNLHTSSVHTEAIPNADNMIGNASQAAAPCEKGPTSEQVSAQEQPSSTIINVASSETGEVTLSLACNRPNFRKPSLEILFKMVEDKCMRSHKILPPEFSLNKIMQEICQCAWEYGSDSNANKQGNVMNGSCQEDDQNKNDEGLGKEKEPLVANGSTSNGLVVKERQVRVGDARPPHDAEDISKGEERIRISLINEFSSEKYPTSFYYIPQNLVYQNAYVNSSLARIGDENCCSDCYGDCLASIPCACVQETGGVFAYTSENLIKDAFLDECISMNREPEKHPHYYCKACPLERAKKDVDPNPCKGHLVRKFIKECWSKCGCNKLKCGNRVVQRGITCRLQVFFTPDGKGWGLRTLDELPRGSFVCEYVGEVLTNMELYKRTIEATGNPKHTYPVLLDADWGSEGVLKDEEALCLDATFYGNVARFINHRCYDANLVEIPVEVESPDHHYYHLAFFTTRKIAPLEELTWDYGIDFDDQHHPIKAFKCRCKSKFCRDAKRSKARKAVASKHQTFVKDARRSS